MVSALSPSVPLASSTAESPAPWPADRRLRWVVRLLLTLPYVVLAIWVDRVEAPVPLNGTIDRAGELVEWGSSDFAWVGAAYPPIPIGLAGLLPGGTLALGLIGAGAAGLLIHSLLERLIARDVPIWLCVVLIGTLVGTPFFGYLASGSLAEFLGFTFVAVAMAGFLRFALFGDTDGGFQAGLLLGLAAACDASSVVFALFLGAAGPLVARRRFRDSPGVGRASAAVLAFPAVLAAAGWAFLEWRFTGTAFASLHASVAAADLSLAGLWEDTRLLGLAVLRLPLFLVCGALLLARRPAAAIGYLLPFFALVLSLWLGVRQPSGMTVLLYTALALLAVPGRPSRPVTVLLAVAGVAQLVIVWLVLLPLSPTVTAWAEALRASY